MQKDNIYFSIDKFEKMTDEQIIEEVQKGDNKHYLF